MRWGMILSVLLISLALAPVLAQEAAAPELRIGALPVLNTLPLYIAQDAGYYDEAGVSVEIVDFVSSRDAQQAALAGEIDGFQLDLVSALKVNANGGDLRLVRHVGITSMPFFAIIVGRDSGVETSAELVGGKIGLSKNTIVQYLTDELLRSAGVDAAAVEYVDIPGIFDRSQQLLDGEITAATLPQPVLHIAREQFGNRILIEDTAVDYVPEALSLSAAALAEKGEAARAFLAAYERAVVAINELNGDLSAYRERYAFQEGGGGQLIRGLLESDAVPLPVFTRAQVPDEASYAAVHDWALAAGLISEARAYGDMVVGDYLPAVTAEELAAAEAQGVELAMRDAGEEAVDEVDLRVSVATTLSSLPLFVAQDAGYFADEGIEVAFNIDMSADALVDDIRSDRIDGAQFGSVLSVAQMLADGDDVKIVRSLEYSNLPIFTIITGPTSGIMSAADLAGKAISIYPGNEADVENMLAAAGLAGQVDLEYLDPEQSGDLVDGLLSGQIPVSIGPPMLSQVLTLYGGRALLDSMSIDGPRYPASLLAFRSEVLAEQGDTVRAFLRALERAIAALNATGGDPAAFGAFASEVGLVVDTLVESLATSGIGQIPMFAPHLLPDAAFFAEVQEWAVAAGYLDAASAYDALVDGSYLPAGE